MQPDAPVAVPTSEPPKKVRRQRHFLAAFFFSFTWGTFGVDRFYMGYWVLGILKLITFGGFGIWTIIDLVFIMTGFMKDKQGREMLQVAEYKKFAANTVLWFAICLGVFILINGLLTIWGLYSLVTSLQNGGGDLQKALDGLTSGVNGGGGTSTTDLINQLQNAQ